MVPKFADPSACINHFRGEGLSSPLPPFRPGPPPISDASFKRHPPRLLCCLNGTPRQPPKGVWAYPRTWAPMSSSQTRFLFSDSGRQCGGCRLKSPERPTLGGCRLKSPGRLRTLGGCGLRRPGRSKPLRRVSFKESKLFVLVLFWSISGSRLPRCCKW